MTSRRAKIKKDIEHPILKKLPAEVRNEILRSAEIRKFPAGSMVCRQGNPGDAFFMIKSGVVTVYRKTKENLKTELAVLGAGDSFGEMALLTGAPRAANVEVAEDVLLISLSKEQFDRILKKYPIMALVLIEQMGTWLIDNDQIIERERTRQYQPPKLTIFDFVIILFLSCMCALIFNHSNPRGIKLLPNISLNSNIGRVSPSSAQMDLKNNTAQFVDAMPSNFYDQEHIPTAINIPQSVFEIMYMMGLSDVDPSQKTIVYGRTISRLYDIRLANKLYLRGHKNIHILEGGLPLWKEKGYPVAP